MKNKIERKDFVRDGERLGLIGGDDGRSRQEGDALVVMPDERWGNPVFADATLNDQDFHIHARLTLDQLAGTGASILLGGHFHYSHSHPEGNCTFRICLDEDISPANKESFDKPVYIVHGMANPHKKHWSLDENRAAKHVVGPSADFFRAGEPFTIDILRRAETLIFQINGQEASRISLRDATTGISDGGGDTGWPVCFGFLLGHAPLRIHEFSAEGHFPKTVFPTSDPWLLNSGGYTHYRLPSLCLAPSGRLLTFTEARRTRPSRAWEWEYALVKDELHCMMKSSDDAGQTWSEQQSVIDRGVSFEAREPSALVDSETGELFLFLRGDPWVVSSHDEGRTWSEPRSLAGAGPGNFKILNPGAANCAIQLHHGKFPGRLLVAFSSRNAIAVLFSDDHGRTWQPGALGAHSHVGEPSVVELADGRIIVSPRARDPRSPGRLFMISHDGGVSFAETRFEPAIPIPGQGELVAVDLPASNGRQPVRAIVFCGEAKNKTHLTLVASLDDGRTWPITQMLDEGPCANLALVALPDGQVGILYESDKYLRQRFMRVPLAPLIESHASGGKA